MGTFLQVLPSQSPQSKTKHHWENQAPHLPGSAAPGAPGNLGRGRYQQEKARLKAAAWISFLALW